MNPAVGTHNSARRFHGLMFRALVAAALGVLSCAVPIRAVPQEGPATRVEVYLEQSHSLLIPAVTNVVVLDPAICRTETAQDQVVFYGLKRGETVVFVWTKERRLDLLVRVVQPPPVQVPPSLRRPGEEAMGHGFFGSSMQSMTASDAEASYFFFHRLQWQQEINGHRVSLRGQGHDSSLPGAPRFNMQTASVEYATGNTNLTLMDSIVDLNGGLEGQILPTPTFNILMVRGVNFSTKRGANQFELFGGATLPSYYLNLSGTRDIAGFTFRRKQAPGLDLFATTAATNVPLLTPAGTYRRRNSGFQTAGFTSRPNKHFSFQGTGGVSTLGAMAQGAMLYAGQNWKAFVSGIRSGANFPLNQLQILATGRSSITAGATFEPSSRASASLFYQHTSTQSGALFTRPGSSDYLNPNLNLVLSPAHILTLNYAYTRSQGGLKLADKSSGNRVDVALSSQLGHGLTNTAEVGVGALSDPLQMNSQSQISLRDSLSIRVKGQNTLFFTVIHNRFDPSLIRRLNQEIDLLSPALRQLFLLDPVAFVQSPNLDPELRALLSSLSPTDTQVTLTGQFLVRRRLNISPTVGFYHTAEGISRKSNSHLLGYTLSYQLTRNLDLQSSLSNLLMWDPRVQEVRHNTVLTVGFNRTFNGSPAILFGSSRSRGTIRGRVFRDMNVNGSFNTGEPGLPGVRVELSTGQAARTDHEGRFEFSGLAPDVYQVTLPLSQFTEPVRVTGSTDVRVELLPSRIVEVDFGIVNFARVMGNVFNDYLLSGKKLPDAPGLRGITVILSNPTTRRAVTTDAGGDYEIDDLGPGDYQLSVDRSTVPPDFVLPEEPAMLKVGPTETVVHNVPLQALRSVAGRVLLKSHNGGGESLKIPGLMNGSAPSRNGTKGTAHALEPETQPALVPLAGVRLAVDHNMATTDADGNFVLRNLPAGELLLTMVPVAPVPAGAAIPSWRIQLPRDPIQVQGATITLSNPQLLQYLLPSSSPKEELPEKKVKAASSEKEFQEKSFENEAKSAYFDFDKSGIRPDAQQTLTADADFFKAHQGVKFTIEGHCDERGSEEYNLGLGDRRATAAKNFLVNLGISADRISMISYGKSRPVCSEHNEGCWQKNRRAHFRFGTETK